jgi:HEXXH motif-containing protein
VISVHRLPWRSFDAICGGAADTTGLSILGAGQLSKHLLLLRLAFDLLPDAARRKSTVVADGLALLEHVRERRPAAFNRLIGYPFLGAGLVHCVRDLRTGRGVDSAVTFLATIAAAAAIRSGQDFELDGVPALGPLHLPTLGTARPDAANAVRLARHGGRVTVGSVVLPDEPEHDRPGWSGVLPLVSAADRVAPVLDDLDPHRGTGGLPVSPRVCRDRHTAWRATYAQAVDVLRERHPGRAAQVDTVLRAVTPLDAQRPGQGRSASAWQAYGAVATTFPGDPQAFAATLIHETQHSVLNGLLDLVVLYDPADNHLYYSPWRADPRPLRGLLHGCYAFLGVADFWARERAVCPGSRRAEFEFARASLQLRQALDTLHEVPVLTADGVHLVARMAHHAEALGTVPLSGTIGHLASLASEDHRLSWRLRVVVPDPAAVDAAARAWRAGARVPKLPGDSRYATTVETFVPNERVRRIGRLARQENTPAVAGSTTDEADDRLLARDFPAAADAYRQAVRTEPDDIAAWTGLALAGTRSDGPGARVWRVRPELVRALYRALDSPGGQPPDPLVLAGWLAGGSAG